VDSLTEEAFKNQSNIQNFESELAIYQEELTVLKSELESGQKDKTELSASVD
jgi:hypothetical protein